MEVYEDKWLQSGDVSLYHVPHESQQVNPLLVADLINHEARQWKGELIKMIFLSHVKEEIHRIPLTGTGKEDKLNGDILWMGGTMSNPVAGVR